MHAYDIGFIVFTILWVISFICSRVAVRNDDFESRAYFSSLMVIFCCMMTLMTGFSQGWW